MWQTYGAMLVCLINRPCFAHDPVGRPSEFIHCINCCNLQSHISLTLKDWGHFSPKTPQICHFELKKSKWIFLYFFALSTVGSCPILLGKHVQKVSKKVDHTGCEIITFEVERKVIFSCARRGQQSFAFGAKVLNYTNLSFCTISMHIMLSTCVPNLRGEG
jgi:hypothetical protein